MIKKTACWIKREHFFSKDEYVCSACKGSTDRPYKVCPRCGAPMKGSKYDPYWIDELEMLDEIFED